MKLSTFLRVFGLAFTSVVMPAFTSAQQTIACEANNDNRKYCGSYDPDQIRLDRQISGSPCVQGQTWGVDRHGLWVEGGCRAIFTIARWNGRRDNSITCESNDGQRNYCGNIHRNEVVNMDQQISGSPCIQGRTWGVDQRGLWVDEGCRAIFSINSEGSGGGSGRGGGGWWDPEPGADWPPRGDWHGGGWDRGGACFYKEPGFSGGFFCLRRGERRESLSDFGDKVSSIRVFGNSRVSVYDDRNFNGANASTSDDVPDLRDWKVRQKQGHTWNDRVSSLRVQ